MAQRLSQIPRNGVEEAVSNLSEYSDFLLARHRSDCAGHILRVSEAMSVLRSAKFLDLGTRSKPGALRSRFSAKPYICKCNKHKSSCSNLNTSALYMQRNRKHTSRLKAQPRIASAKCLKTGQYHPNMNAECRHYLLQILVLCLHKALSERSGTPIQPGRSMIIEPGIAHPRETESKILCSLVYRATP